MKISTVRVLQERPDGTIYRCDACDGTKFIGVDLANREAIRAAFYALHEHAAPSTVGRAQ